MAVPAIVSHACAAIHGMRAFFMMLTVQVVFAGVNIFYKLAANDGMNLRILVAYRFLFAAAFIAPLAFVLERRSRPKLTWKVLGQAFLCGLFGGSLAQNLYLESLALTSATFASAMANLVPAVTFVLAVSFGLEKLAIKRLSGRAKLIGTLLGISGAMLLTFYKGVVINLWPWHIHLGGNRHSQQHDGKRLFGALASIASCLSYSTWLILQAKMSQRYPSHYSSTALMSMMGAVQALVFALIVDHNWDDWKLGWNIRLLTVVYSGVIGTGLMVTVQAWCVRLKGPLYVSVFNPLMLVLVALAGSLLLDEKLHLGSVLGAVLIVTGLYGVLWGKAQEMKRMSKLVSSMGTVDGDDHQVTETLTCSKKIDCNHHDEEETNGDDDVVVISDQESSVKLDVENLEEEAAAGHGLAQLNPR